MNRRNYYNISKDFVAKSLETNHQYCIKNINNLKEEGKALIATEIDETFTIYIPVNEELIEVMRGVESYQYFLDTLLLRKEKASIVIKPDSYQESFGERVISIVEIKAQTIYGDEVNIRREISDLGENIICNADGVDYLVKNLHIPYHPQVEIIKLGRVEIIPDNECCLKVTDDSGEHMLDKKALANPTE